MKVTELFNVANDFALSGNGNLAIEMWNKCIQKDEFFGPAYINLYNAYQQMGNVQASKDALEKFMNCPLTPNTFKILPKLEKEYEELKKKLAPQPAPPQPQEAGK